MTKNRLKLSSEFFSSLLSWNQQERRKVRVNVCWQQHSKLYCDQRDRDNLSVSIIKNVNV